MADKKKLSLKPTSGSKAGASGFPMNGGEVLAPKPSTTKSLGLSLHACCTQVEEETFTGELGAPKRKAPTPGPKGSATKRKGDCGLSKREEAADGEAAAEKAAVTDVHGEKMQQKRESILEKCAAEFAQFVDDMFGNGPNAIPVKWVDHSPFMRRYGQDYEEEEEEEELGSVDDGTPPSVSN
jgi:hypothetical protein